MSVIAQCLPLLPAQDGFVWLVETTGKAILSPENRTIGRPDEIMVGLEDPRSIYFMCIATGIHGWPVTEKDVIGQDKTRVLLGAGQAHHTCVTKRENVVAYDVVLAVVLVKTAVPATSRKLAVPDVSPWSSAR